MTIRGQLQQQIEHIGQLSNTLIRVQETLKYLIEEHEDVDGQVSEHLTKASRLLEDAINRL